MKIGEVTMGRTELLKLSIGDLFRSVLGMGPGEVPPNTRIEDSITGLMARVEGAELVSSRETLPDVPIQVGNACGTTYHFAEEGVTIEFEAHIAVKIYGTGPREGIEAVYSKIYNALRQRPEVPTPGS